MSNPLDDHVSREAITRFLSQGGVDAEGAALVEILLTVSPDCIKLLDCDGRLRRISARCREVMEFDDLSHIEGRPWVELWPDESRREVAAATRAACDGQIARFSAYRPTAKGTPKWWDVVVSPIRDATGAVTLLLTVARDITVIKEYERSLAASEQKFRALADTIPQLAWMAKPTGEVFWYNRRWLEYTGASVEDMAGWGWQSVHHPDHVERVTRNFKTSIMRGESWEDIFPLRGVDGTYRWFLSGARPLRDASGAITLWCGTNTDVTEHRATAERLRSLSRIIERSQEAIFMTEPAGAIILWNRGCEELYGYSKSEAIGANAVELLQTKLPMCEAEFRNVLQTTGEWAGELLTMSKAGDAIWVDSRKELIRAGGQDVLLETNRDVTERKRADEFRNLMLGELNHRVKNTLSVVQSIASQTARATPDPKAFLPAFNGRLHALSSAHTALSDAEWAGAGLKGLIQSEMMLSAGDASALAVSGEDVFLAPEAALQVTMLIHELAANAVRHGALSAVGGRVHVSWQVISANPTVVRLIWRETGGPDVTPPAAKGFGLLLIERTSRLPHLKADVSFEADGVVATIDISLTDAEARKGLFVVGSHTTASRVEFRPAPRVRASAWPRVLVLAADPIESTHYEEMLDSAGFQPVVPSSAADAMDVAGARSIHLALIDIDSPGVHLGAVMAVLAQRGIPVVALSRHGEDMARTLADAKPVALVEKPVVGTDLVRAVSQAARAQDGCTPV